MALATWWYEDGYPRVEPLPGMRVDGNPDDGLLARMADLDVSEVGRRREQGNRPYLAWVGGRPASYGWVGTRHASIGELDLEFALPPGNRYLWDFATLPDFRGRGIYPALLAEIVRRESPPATRLWIIHAPENVPSGLGIVRSGFAPVASLSLASHGRAALAAAGDPLRAEAASQFLGLPLMSGDLDPCWRCGGCACTEPAADGSCCCAITPTR